MKSQTLYSTRPTEQKASWVTKLCATMGSFRRITSSQGKLKRTFSKPSMLTPTSKMAGFRMERMWISKSSSRLSNGAPITRSGSKL